MKALVLGANGFLAKNLIKELAKDNRYEKIHCTTRKSGYAAESIQDKNDRVVDVYCELTNLPHVKSLFKVIEPDIIFHLASEQGRTIEAFEANTAITVNLLKCCPKECRIVYASSSTVYGDLASVKKGASGTSSAGKDIYGNTYKCLETDITVPTSYYGLSKLMGEALIRIAKPDSLILRYVAMVGTGATHGVLPDIIRKLKLQGDEIELFGEYPGSLKQYISVDDAVSATLHLVNKNVLGTYNVSPADEIDIQKIAMYARYAMGLDGKKTFKWNSEAKPLGDNKAVALSNEKLLSSGWIAENQFSMGAIMKATKEILAMGIN